MNGFNRTTVYADRGTFGLNRRSTTTESRVAQRSQAAGSAEVDQFATEMDDFAALHHQQPPTSVPGEMGLRDVRTMMALYESARTGRTVRLA